jgi:predicted dinucleotide-binding enzyme
MKITTVGRGTIAGGLARLWEQAGHSVRPLGREGGDATVFYRFATPGDL